MKRFLSLFCLVLVSGCASVNYGPLSVKTLGTDVSFSEATWMSKGDFEMIHVIGAKKDATTSTHTAANLVMGILGGVLGAPAGAPGVAAGSAGGVGIAELWQSVQDYLNRPKVETPKVETPDSGVLTNVLQNVLLIPGTTNYIPIVTDPKITDAELKAQNEETHLEGTFKIPFRGHVWVPSTKKWHTMSSPWIVNGQCTIVRAGDIKVVPTGYYRDQQYKIRGWMPIEPKDGDGNPTLSGTGNRIPWGERHVIVECY